MMGLRPNFQKKCFGSLKNLYKVSIHFLTDSMYYIIDNPRYHIEPSIYRYIENFDIFNRNFDIPMYRSSIYRSIDNLPPWVLAKQQIGIYDSANFSEMWKMIKVVRYVGSMPCRQSLILRVYKSSKIQRYLKLYSDPLSD